MVAGSAVTALSDPNISWETSTITNVGLDLGLWNNSFSVTVDVFDKKTTDILARINIPGQVGNLSGPITNLYSMSNKGFECDCVENGEQAIEAISNDVYDLVLMDNHMPVMDGIEATTAIRKLDSSKSRVLIVGCTADVFKETRAHMKSAGVDFIIPKPIDETELDDALFAFADTLYQYTPH